MLIANANCVPTQKMKEYLSGWLDEQSSDSIECHLKECSRCEELISSLEREPDSISDQIREQIAESIGRGGRIAESECPNAFPDAAVAYAIERAKKQHDPSEIPSESFSPLAPTVQSHIGPYEIERVLGHGGMGSVYLAMHSQLHKQVAVKILPSRPFRNDNYAARFKREIRTAGQLNHHAIVQATDAGESDGMHYLVMEFVDGLDVSRVARVAGELSIADACAIASVVAIGLSHAHTMGIVHRDINLPI